MLLAMLPAKFPVLKAEPARFEAWLNLSQREKASVFMTVRTSAMTIMTHKCQRSLILSYPMMVQELSQDTY